MPESKSERAVSLYHLESCLLLRCFFLRLYFFVSLLFEVSKLSKVCACALELTVLNANCIRESRFKIGKNLLHFVCGLHVLVAHKRTYKWKSVTNTHRIFYLHSETHMWHIVHGWTDFNVRRERKSPAGHISCARAHQYWHVIAQLCTEMGIRKSEIEVSSERNENRRQQIFQMEQIECIGLSMQIDLAQLFASDTFVHGKDQFVCA